jgi:hypothetical protein
MRKPVLPAVLMLTALGVAAATAWAATARFVPPQEAGTIFAVINFTQSLGENQHTRVTGDWGPFHRSEIVGRPYGLCTGTTAGFVLMVRRFDAGSYPFTLSTSGKIVRGPYQGVAPPEIGKRCYKLVKWRARF